MTVKRGILWFSVGTSGLLFVFVAFCWSLIQWHRSAIEPVDPLPRLERAVVDANLPYPEGEALRRYLLSNPSTIAELMKSEDFALRSAAHDFLRWHKGELSLQPDDAEKFVDCMRRQYADQQFLLFRVIREIGPAGYLAVATLFEDDRPLSAEQMRQMRWYFDNPDALDAIQRLLAVSENEKIVLANRLQALEVIGFAKNSGASSLGVLERLRESENAELARAARVAIARILDEPTVERIEADISWFYRHDRCRLEMYFRELWQYGARAREAGPLLLQELKPLAYTNGNTGKNAAIALAKIGYYEAVPSLIEALDYIEDLDLAEGAAEALGRLKAVGAEEALLRKSQHSPFRMLSQIAANAVQALHGKYEYSDQFDESHVIARKWSDELQPAITEQTWWEKSDAFYYFQRSWCDLKAGWVALISPRIDRVRIAWSGTGQEGAEFEFSLLPRHRLSIQGGILLGYDEGEFASGLVCWRKGEIPAYYPVPNVTTILPWKQGALVITSTHTIGMIYEVRFDSDRGFIVSPLIRRLGSLEGDDDIILNPDGSITLYGNLHYSTDGVWKVLD